MSRDLSRHLTRRDVLLAGAATLGAFSVGTRSLLAAIGTGRYGPFKMGIQSYSLRGYKRDVALAKTKELGLHYWESYSAHIPIDPSKVDEARVATKASDVEVIGFGVVPFTKDGDKNRKTFEFAKAMGVEYLSADPTPDAFDSLDKLVSEYGIAIGIHNHGPGHRWAKIDDIAAAIKDHHEKIGVCNDTGHFLRSNEDPVRAVEVFGKRTYGVHLKDVKNAKTFTILGEGDLRVADLLQALAKIKYSYCLAVEYEEHPENPIAEIQACLEAAAKAAATIKS